MVQIRFALHPLYKDIAPAAGRLAIEHAALDCRIHETFLALALLIPGEVAFYTDSVERVRHRLDSWLAGKKGRVKSFSGGRFFSCRAPSTTLWIITPAAKPASLFFSGNLTAAFVTDAHAFEEDVTKALEGIAPTKKRGSGASSTLRCLYVAGHHTGVGHWFHRLCHDRHRAWASRPKVRRLDCDAVAKAFPDQAPRILPKDDPRYAWSMRLRDPLRNERVAPIIVFARKRLKIRTDLRPDDLSDAQRREVEAELVGARWTKGSSFTVSLEFGAVQRRILAWKRFARARGFRKFIIVKYRRAGVTVLSQAEAYYHCLKQPKSYVMFVAHLDKTIQRLFDTVKTFAERDPFSPGIKGKPTSNKIRFLNGSYCFIGTGKSEGLARGDTISYFHGSEVPYWARGQRAIAAMDLLMSGIEESTRHGEIVLEGTPKGREWMCNKFGEAKKGLNDYFPIFLPWFLDPTCRLLPSDFNAAEVLETLSEEEKSLVARYGLAPDQIAFRRTKKKQYGALFNQEFPEDDESCFISAGTMFFNHEKVSELSLRVVEPPGVRKLIHGGYEIRWQEPIPGVAYCAGVDSSAGKAGGDLNGVGVLRRDTLEQVASVHGLFSTTELAAHAVRLSVQYNRALLGIERENHGHAVLDRVEALGYGRPHYRGGSLYYHGYDPRKKGSASRGWTTNEKTRTQIIEDLDAALVSGSLIVNDRDFISELTTFCRQSNGRWDHDSGAHDDTIFKWGIALQMTKHRRVVPTMPIYVEDF